MTLIPNEFKDEKKFLVYKLTLSSDRPGKLDKKPCWDWSDPSRWMSPEDAARQAGEMGPDHGLGYVITEDSGRFFFDLDGCRDAVTGKLSKMAWDVIALFIGAYVEVSVSGTGIHILGKYQGGRPSHSCRNGALGMELYTSGRWCAMGTPHEIAGSVDFVSVLSTSVTKQTEDMVYSEARQIRIPVVWAHTTMLYALERE